MNLNPGLQRRPKEASMIGHMLLAYGELEFLVAICLGEAIGSRDSALRMMFRITGETSRIQAADAIMRDAYIKAGLQAQYAAAYGAVRECVLIRNQYAHCHWAEELTAGLFFTSLQEPAKASESFEYWFRHVDAALLEKQTAYFDYAAEGLEFIFSEFMLRGGKVKSHAASMPKAQKPPRRHNPPEKHIPPWLAEDQKRRHIERAQEQEPAARPHKAKPKAPSQRQKRESRVQSAKKKAG